LIIGKAYNARCTSCFSDLPILTRRLPLASPTLIDFRLDPFVSCSQWNRSRHIDFVHSAPKFSASGTPDADAASRRGKFPLNGLWICGPRTNESTGGHAVTLGVSACYQQLSCGRSSISAARSRPRRLAKASTPVKHSGRRTKAVVESLSYEVSRSTPNQ
jgi:hypothetical protein